MSCAWVKTMNPIAKTKTTTPIPINLAMQHFTHPTNAPAFGTTGAGFAQGRGSTFHARNARVMTVLRHARLALFALLSITLLVTDRHPARGQTPAPVAAKPAAASCQRAAFRVVVDVGHTVDVPGAISAHGVPEYAFNLQLGQDINHALIDAGFDKSVLLVTATAPWRGLVERAARANSM